MAGVWLLVVGEAHVSRTDEDIVHPALVLPLALLSCTQ